MERSRDFGGLERLARRAVAELSAQLGPRSGEVAGAFRWLASALHDEGRDADAIQALRRALAIDEAASGLFSLVAAADLAVLAELLQKGGNLAEAEALAKRALAIRERTFGPEHPQVATTLLFVAELVFAQGRHGEAEPLLRRALAIREKVFGPDHAATLQTVNALAQLLETEGRYLDAEPFLRRALAIAEKVFGPANPETAVSITNLGGMIQGEGRHAEAELLYRRALGIRERTLGPQDPATAASLFNVADMLEAQGRYSEAEPLYRRALSICEAALGPENPRVAQVLNSLAGMSQNQGRFAEAEPLFRRALAIDEKAGGPDSEGVATGLNNLSLLLERQGRYAEAEPLLRRSLAIMEKRRGPDHQLTAAALGNLGSLLWDEGHPSEAEPLLRRALAVDQKALGPNSAGTATSVKNLAELLIFQQHYADAEPLLRKALAIQESTLGATHHLTTNTRAALGANDEHLGKFADAAANYRLACLARSAVARSRNQSGDSARSAERRASICWTRLAISLRSWSAQGGGATPRDGPEALKVEAFAASQNAIASAAGDAMARSAALTAAKSAAVGPQAQAYEAALIARDDLDLQFAKAAAAAGTEGVEKRQALAKAQQQAVDDIATLAAELKAKAPRYWDYRAPEPVTVAALQASTGPDAVLLHADEALILLLAETGMGKGEVFAVTKERAAWAQLGFSGDEIKARVVKLRGQIDPDGYGLRGIRVEQHGAAPAPIPDSGAFSRQAAYELYQALLGDAAIQAVIKDKPLLLFVPSGALTSLPPGLLVTAPPPGGRAGDTDPAALRSTAWLLRSKAVALLPAVSSLRTLRQLIAVDRGTAPDPLLAFADPDFERTARAAVPRLASAAARGFGHYYRDGVPLAEALDGLPRLPGTRVEGEALVRALHAPPGSLLMGRDASKAQLMARNADGRLARVRVLEFATHGLVAGDASDLAEPALALAAGASASDELLLASEASTLKLNADWVLLSACNTASPDAPEAQGLSGLSRAFFFAGAQSLLVSHWRVRDDVAPRLIPGMLLAERATPGLSRAQALRQASLAVLDDLTLNAAEPSAWAPFTLVGEAAR